MCLSVCSHKFIYTKNVPIACVYKNELLDDLELELYGFDSLIHEYCKQSSGLLQEQQVL